MIDDIEIIDILVVLMLVTHTWCCGQTDRNMQISRTIMLVALHNSVHYLVIDII